MRHSDLQPHQQTNPILKSQDSSTAPQNTWETSLWSAVALRVRDYPDLCLGLAQEADFVCVKQKLRQGAAWKWNFITITFNDAS